MILKKPMRMVPMIGSSVIEVRPNAVSDDYKRLERESDPRTIELLIEIDAERQARTIAGMIADREADSIGVLGPYIQEMLTRSDVKASILRAAVQDALVRPAFATLRQLYDAAFYSDSARRELRFRMQIAQNSADFVEARSKKKPPQISAKRYRQLSAALEVYEFMDVTMKRFALQIGFAYFIAYAPSQTLTPEPPSGMNPVSWPLVPEDWTPATDDEIDRFEALKIGASLDERYGTDNPSFQSDRSPR